VAAAAGLALHSDRNTNNTSTCILNTLNYFRIDCPPNDIVNDKALNTCLGDLYSVNWMEDADLDTPRETLEQQFDTVKQETTKSHVLQFGDVASMGADLVAQFIGGASAETETASGQRPQLRRQDAFRSLPLSALDTTPEAQLSDEQRAAHARKKHDSAVDSRDIPLVSMFYQYLRDPTEAHSIALVQHINERQQVDRLFASMARRLVGLSGVGTEAGSSVVDQVLRGESPPGVASDFECVREASEMYVKVCTDGTGAGWTDYSMKYAKSLHVLCQLGVGIPEIHAALQAECVAVQG
jgi:hypothetical protein